MCARGGTTRSGRCLVLHDVRLTYASEKTWEGKGGWGGRGEGGREVASAIHPRKMVLCVGRQTPLPPHHEHTPTSLSRAPFPCFIGFGLGKQCVAPWFAVAVGRTSSTWTSPCSLRTPSAGEGAEAVAAASPRVGVPWHQGVALRLDVESIVVKLAVGSAASRGVYLGALSCC